MAYKLDADFHILSSPHNKQKKEKKNNRPIAVKIKKKNIK